MFDKIYFDSYNMSYNQIMNFLKCILEKNNDIISLEKSSKTYFGFDIDVYKIGKGKKDIVFIGATHGLELVTIYFVIELMLNIIDISRKNNDFFNNYTFHFISILNPEGVYISLQNVYMNLKDCNKKEFESICGKYLTLYNLDDENALKGLKCSKNFINVLECKYGYIENMDLRESVINILKRCNLDERYMLVWAANGLGIDQNSNSIHKFNLVKALRKKQKNASLRYNDIPVTIPSPMSYPGEYRFDRSLENKFLYEFLNDLYVNNNLKNIFSFHSTGGQIYSFPEYGFVSDEALSRYDKIMKKYSSITGYEIMHDEYKYGVMDYYRASFSNTVSLTIELSKLNANPIGPFSNIAKLQDEFVLNKKAIFECINLL